MTPLFLHAVAARLAAAPAGGRPALLDIGANHGWFSNLAAAAGFAVAAFEPVPEHCDKIRQSLALNDFGQEQVILYENIVSTRDETLYMNIFPMGPSATAYVSSEPEEGVTENNIKEVPAVPPGSRFGGFVRG